MKTVIAVMLIVLAMFLVATSQAIGVICVPTESVYLSWDANPAEDGNVLYKVFHSFSVTGPYNHIATIADTYCTVNGLPEGAHVFALTAIDICGNESGQSESSEPVIKDTIAPSVPAGLTVSAVTE